MSARLLGVFISINILLAMINVAWSGVGRPESPILDPAPGLHTLDNLSMPMDDWRCARDQLNAVDLEGVDDPSVRLDPDFSICLPPTHAPR